MSTETSRWQVGDVAVTVVVEEQTDHIPPQLFFPDATAEEVAEQAWLAPDFADDGGGIGMRIQAFVVEAGGRTIVVDPCVGNGKTLQMPFWHQQAWAFWERFEKAGFTAEGVDVVVHTHLHADHVGWDTRLADGYWVPTFTGARHLYNEAQLAFVRDPGGYDNANVLSESVQPILDAGLHEVVAEDADLGDGLRLAPTGGHTPGHVSLWIESVRSDDPESVSRSTSGRGAAAAHVGGGAVGGSARPDRTVELALLTGDFFHHPVQCARPDWAEIGDADVDEARVTRRRMLSEAASTGALVFGTHFPTRPVGHIVEDGPAWRFVPA